MVADAWWFFGFLGDGFPAGADAIGCGLAAYIRKPVICPDVLLDPSWVPYLWLARRFDYRATWSFPVPNEDGKVVGTFCVYCRQSRDMTPHDLEVATALTHAAAVSGACLGVLTRGGPRSTIHALPFAAYLSCVPNGIKLSVGLTRSANFGNPGNCLTCLSSRSLDFRSLMPFSCVPFLRLAIP